MRADLRLLLGVLVTGALALTAGCGGSGDPPIRVGVLLDCVGILRPLEGAELAGAELPLLQRGARLRGTQPGDGITDARVAGSGVQLVPACTETLEFTTMFQEVRRLIEKEHVDAVVGGSVGLDEVGLRTMARRYPTVPFVTAAPGPREVTLRARAPNLVRVAADHGQGVAGLATYAFHRLGWRRVAIVATDWDLGWGSAAAFVREFCSLGGRVVEQKRVIAFDAGGARDARRLAGEADGVAVLTTGFLAPQETFVAQLVSDLGNPARRLVVGPGVVGDVATMQGVPGLTGVVGAALTPPASASASGRDYLSAFRKAFGGAFAEGGREELTIVNRNAMEAVVEALERAGGDRTKLLPGLRALDTTLLGVPVRVDANGQAVVSSTLVRIGAPTSTGARPLAVVRSIPGVDQSVGGLLAPDLRPASRDVPCRRSAPPSWAQ